MRTIADQFAWHWECVIPATLNTYGAHSRGLAMFIGEGVSAAVLGTLHGGEGVRSAACAGTDRMSGAQVQTGSADLSSLRA